jgi:hypothetical protein
LVLFYWQVGNELSKKQAQFKWGEKLVEQFSDDMRQAFPEMQGFSITNLKRMRIFAQTYPDFEISPQPVGQSINEYPLAIWSNNVRSKSSGDEKPLI